MLYGCVLQRGFSSDGFELSSTLCDLRTGDLVWQECDARSGDLSLQS